MSLIELKRELNKLYIDLKEVRAYRNLQSKGFDFGTGLITNDSNESEDAYYEMEEQDILDCIENIQYIMREYNEEIINKKSRRYNRYNRKRIREKKLRDLEEKGAYATTTKESEEGKEYLTRFYLSGRKTFAKKQSNKVIRKSRNNFSLYGGGYRKKYDYWWTVY